MIRQLRLLVLSYIISLAVCIVPKDCVKTLAWIKKMPFEN
jgi:hypothetical protein